jgi:predicted tellurium resistance membrane protein TerC
MEWILEPQIWIGLLTLTALEIVLGIDNIVFISILAGRLPGRSQKKARIWGLAV